jgi:hypothetical protein
MPLIGLSGVEPGDGRLDRDSGRELGGPARHGLVWHDLTDLQVGGFGDVGAELFDPLLEVGLAQRVLEEQPRGYAKTGRFSTSISAASG